MNALKHMPFQIVYLPSLLAYIPLSGRHRRFWRRLQLPEHLHCM